MTNSTSPFEEMLRTAVQTPQPSVEFITSLRNRLSLENPRAVSPIERLGLMLRRPVWVTSITILLLTAVFFIAGPQRVVAAMRELFGYIPGVGIVDANPSLRVLAEPVTAKKDGITIHVISAVLSGKATHIDYQVIGVPGSAYPTQSCISACTRSDYLRLPDGRQLGHDSSAHSADPTKKNFLPIPPNVNEALLVIPCISNTLPGSVPENWEIPLRFVPAPSDMVVIPVIESSPSPQSPTRVSQTITGGNDTIPTTPEASAVFVNKVIQTENNYILLGRLQIPEGETIVPDGKYSIRDASGKVIDHEYPQDINLDMTSENKQEIVWAAQTEKSGLVFPLTISFPMMSLYKPDPSATAKFEFDAGTNPQACQDLAVKQEVQILGHTLKLISLKVGSRNDYSFTFQVDADVFGANVQIEGYPSIGILGGGNEGGTFERSLAFSEIPTGKLTVIISQLTLIKEKIDLQGKWSPGDTPQ